MIELGVQGQQSKRTDIEVLCEIIYAHGERYILYEIYHLRTWRKVYL